MSGVATFYVGAGLWLEGPRRGAGPAAGTPRSILAARPLSAVTAVLVAAPEVRRVRDEPVEHLLEPRARKPLVEFGVTQRVVREVCVVHERDREAVVGDQALVGRLRTCRSGVGSSGLDPR